VNLLLTFMSTIFIPSKIDIQEPLLTVTVRQLLLHVASNRRW
jgi:hypothetical protein